MKQTRILSLLLLCSSLLLTHRASAIAQIEPRLASGPEIRSISPDRAGAGQRITIRGRNFSKQESEDKVLFDGREATVIKAKRKKLVVEVPEQLPAGNVLDTVTVAGQISNAEEFEFVPPVNPLPGEFRGRTSQDKNLSLVVLENRDVATQFRTSFDCASSTCSATINVDIDLLAEIENGHFEVEISNATASVTVTGLFLSETEAEGTVEFNFSGGCNCENTKLTWSVKRVLPPPDSQWSVVSGQWPVAVRQWPVASGQWSVSSGQWPVVSGQ